MSDDGRSDSPQAEITLEARRLLGEGDFQRAFALCESLIGAGSADCGLLLDAAECAIEMRSSGRALEILGQAEARCGGPQMERWVNLRSEALRRSGKVDEGLQFVTEWSGRVGPEVEAKLMVRKAAFLFAKGDPNSARDAVRRAWALVPRGDQRWLVSLGNVALLAGEMTIAGSAGKRLLRDHRSMGGLILWLYSSFLGLALAGRLIIGLLLATVLLVDTLHPLYLALVASLVVSAFVARRTPLVTTAFSLVWSAAALGVAYILILLAGTGNVPLVLGVLVAVVALILAVLALRRSRRRVTPAP
jgi:hypothetical protein